MDKVRVLNVEIDNYTMGEAIVAIENLIDNQGPHLVVTANSEMIMMANKDPLLAEIIRKADVVVPDGAGVVWASRVLGSPLKERIPGIELMENLLEKATEKKWRVFFLGGKPGVAELAAQKMVQKYPGLNIVGCHHGYFDRTAEEVVVSTLVESKPHLLFIGLGVPRQEKWAALRLAQVKVPVAMGVGGSFDVLAGVSKRAPKWMQNMSLEWFYRLLREPRRIKRMSVLPLFVLYVYLERLVTKEDI